MKKRLPPDVQKVIEDSIPWMENEKDKVQLGDPAKGELMISEGASDYVPPTKMEDWPWPYPRDKWVEKP